jgi:hypothetical protein
MSFSLTLGVYKVNGITSFEVENPPGMAEQFWDMPEANLYMVCLSKNKDSLRSVKGGIAVLTRLTHHDPEFADMLIASVRSNFVLASVIAKTGMSIFRPD